MSSRIPESPLFYPLYPIPHGRNYLLRYPDRRMCVYPETESGNADHPDFLENAPPYISGPEWSFCEISNTVCQASSFDTFLLCVAIWATIQLSWTSILAVSQLWQLSRQMTTFEVSNLGRYGFMGGRGGQSLRDQSGAMRQAGTIGAGTGMSGALENGVPGEVGGTVGVDGNLVLPPPPDGTYDHGHGHGHHHHRHGIMGCCANLGKAISGPLFKILGLDRFTKGKAMSGMARAGRGQNPFDLGVVQVCSPLTSMT